MTVVKREKATLLVHLVVCPPSCDRFVNLTLPPVGVGHGEHRAEVLASHGRVEVVPLQPLGHLVQGRGGLKGQMYGGWAWNNRQLVGVDLMQPDLARVARSGVDQVVVVRLALAGEAQRLEGRRRTGLAVP